jgi:hypothetical protein
LPGDPSPSDPSPSDLSPGNPSPLKKHGSVAADPLPIKKT